MTGAKDVARFFIYMSQQTDGDSINVTRLSKLLFFAQGHMLGEYGTLLFHNEVDAWAFGPVVAAVYSSYDKIEKKTCQIELNGIELSPRETDLLIDVWNQYRQFSAKELTELTHRSGTPWETSYKEGEKGVHIPTELMRSFFSRDENRLRHTGSKVNSIPQVSALPAEEYDPEEDAIWEAMLHDD